LHYSFTIHYFLTAFFHTAKYSLHSKNTLGPFCLSHILEGTSNKIDLILNSIRVKRTNRCEEHMQHMGPNDYQAATGNPQPRTKETNRRDLLPDWPTKQFKGKATKESGEVFPNGTRETEKVSI